MRQGGGLSAADLRPRPFVHPHQQADLSEPDDDTGDDINDAADDEEERERAARADVEVMILGTLPVTG